MTEKKRVLLVCPGRGSYRPNTMGILSNRSDQAMSLIQQCDTFRAEKGRKTVSELDGSDSFKGQMHVAGENASLLTFACSLADAAELDKSRYEVVGILGNSMGFYSALAISGAMTTSDAILLVETMAQYQVKNVQGGQIMYPIVSTDWQSSAEHLETVATSLRKATEAGHQAYWSIHLGSHAVLGADKAGLKFLLKDLTPVTIGPRTFPLQLPLHSAFHTPLMEDTARIAQQDLAALPFAAPTIPLVDGRGHIFRPHWASPDALKAYTLGTQVIEPYLFQTSLFSALNHCGPDVIVALGPGNALGGPLARSLVQCGWRGMQNASDFEEIQQHDPVLLSFGVTKQRSLLV